MSPSRFIRPIHPKAEIAPTRPAIAKVIALGWWGQMKVHGHRVQLHIPHDETQAICAYNRQGQLHRKALSPALVRELRRIFKPDHGFTVIDGEWLKDSERIFVFDILKRANQLLDDWTYAERYELLPRVYASAHIETLPVLKTTEQCMSVLADPSAYCEGLVFRAPNTRGFVDSSIVRCRR